MAICIYNGNVNDLPQWAKDSILPEESIIRLPGLNPITNYVEAKIIHPGDYIIKKRDGNINVISKETMNSIYENIPYMSFY